jgi:hypothetical protein
MGRTYEKEAISLHSSIVYCFLTICPDNSLIYGGVHFEEITFGKFSSKLQIQERRQNMPNRDKTGPPAGSRGPRDGRGEGKGGGRVGGRGKGIGAKKGGKKGSR